MESASKNFGILRNALLFSGNFNSGNIHKILHSFLSPQDFGPDGQNPRRHPSSPRVKGGIFRPSEKTRFLRTRLTKDYRKCTGGPINTPQKVYSLRNCGDSDVEQIENYFKDPEDGFGIKQLRRYRK